MTTTTPKPTPDQRRARHAWRVAEQMRRNATKEQDTFETQAKKLPTRILTSGLGQALAFLHGKQYAEDLQRALGDWVLDKRANPESQKSPPQTDALLKHLIENDSDFLRFATCEVLAYMQWLNRFCEGTAKTNPETRENTNTR